jgi:hypothetical protein
MSVFTYATAGASMAIGALAAARWLLSLITGPAWAHRLRRAIRIGRVTNRRRRREFWCYLGSALALVVVGVLNVVGAHDDTAAVAGAVVGGALLIFQLGSLMTFRIWRRSPG